MMIIKQTNTTIFDTLFTAMVFSLIFRYFIHKFNFEL
jgi:hypothetical protein